jgi:hypothetical protein
LFWAGVNKANLFFYSRGKANGRNWGKIVSAIIVLIGFMMAGFTQKKQALHDIMAATLRNRNSDCVRIFWVMIYMYISLVFANLSFANSDIKYIEEMSKTYGYCYGQQYSLDIIKKKFPELRQKTLIVNSSFNTNFKSSYQKIESFLQLIFKDEWTNYKKKIVSQVASMTNPDQISKNQAIAFLNLVEKRSTGEMESPIVQTLLSFNPIFKNRPEEEFSMGFKNTYRTKGHPKAQDLDIQIEYPKSWKPREGKRPHIVQFFRNNYGHGNVMMSLIIRSFPPDIANNLSDKELSDFFVTKDERESMVPEGFKVLNSEPIVLDNQQGSLLILEANLQRMDMKQKFLVHQYTTIYDKKIIMLQLKVRNTTGTDETLTKEYQKNKKLFWLIANSLIIQNQYY